MADAMSKGSYNGFAYIYDKLTDDVEYEKRADYIEHLFKMHMDYKPELVCDLACGTGTICRLMCEKGYDMIGIDNSLDMLNVAKEKSQDSKILYLNQDICDFELYGTVDAITCMLDSVNYLTEDGDIERLLSLVKNYLNPGGVFIFDINTPYKYENILADNIYTYEHDDIFYTWENSFDGEYLDFYLNFFIKNSAGTYERITETHCQRMYTPEYLQGEIKKCGLELAGIYNDLSFESAENTSERIMLVVKKC